MIDQLLYVRIPMRLVSEANQREHHFAKARRVKSQRATVGAHLLAMRGRVKSLVARCPLDVEITRVAPRSLDQGGNIATSAKAVQDEIAAFLGIDDRDEDRVRYIVAQRKEPKTYAVEIRIARRVTA